MAARGLSPLPSSEERLCQKPPAAEAAALRKCETAEMPVWVGWGASLGNGVTSRRDSYVSFTIDSW